MELIADGSTVTWGGAATVRDLGIPEALISRSTLEALDRDLAESPEEKGGHLFQGIHGRLYLTSARSSSDSLLPKIIWHPEKVFFVIGLNKVAQTVEAAQARGRSNASPTNVQPLDINTPVWYFVLTLC